MQPCILIASPQMSDPFFERTVVLVWHHDEEGAIGVVVNRPLEHRLEDVLAMEDVDLAEARGLVAWGGPVEATSGTVVARGSVGKGEGWMVGDVGITRSEDALRRLIGEGNDLMLCLGYAGWGPGQLDREIESGGWLWTDCDPQLIFDSPMEDRYDAALATLGLTRHTVWMTPINE